ncbi:tripartite tricarboxylate transporter substrate binding protein [Rhodobacteraceae bacterium]|nr:tripartite tricarboxylate transporter substrate binding protein [Paracoccaceae bacterium]
MKPIMKLMAAATLGLSALTSTAIAEDYPDKTITWIAPFSAGGGADRWSRTLSSVAFDVMDQAMRVRNIPGASATVGWGEMLKQPADGYTVMLSSPTPIIALVTEPNAPFGPDEAKIVAFISAFRGIILVKPETEWSDWDSFVAYAKANPGKISLGSTFSEMVGAQLAFDSEGIDVNLIPYDSTSDSVTDFLGGHVDAIGVTESTALNMVPEEALALINVTTLPLSEEVAAKLGNPPHAAALGYETINFPRWVGVHPDTSDEIVEKLSAHVGAMLEQESVQTITGKMGEEIIFVPWQEAQPQYEALVAGIRKAAPAITGK